MQSVRLTCGGCGGPLEITQGDRLAVCVYCGNQAELQDQHPVALTGEQRDPYLEIEKLRLQQELMQCDLEWEKARAKLLVQGKEPAIYGLDTLLYFCLAVPVVISLYTGYVLLSSYLQHIPTEFELEVVLQQRSRAWGMFWLHLPVYIIPVMVYLAYLTAKDRFEVFSNHRRRYHSRRESLLTAIAELDE